jgi:hypothetical protein
MGSVVSWLCSGFLVRGVLVDGSRIHGSIFESRAVLRALKAFWDRDANTDPSALGLPRPQAYRDQAAKLLRARLSRDGSVDGVVSTTVAALDIRRLVALKSETVHAGRSGEWLRSRFEGSTVSDQFDIARALRDEDLLRLAIGNASDTSGRGRAVPVGVAMRWMRAATEVGWSDLLPTTLADTEVLEDSVIAACEYLCGLLALHGPTMAGGNFGDQWAGLVDGMDKALATIARLSVLLPRGDGESLDVWQQSPHVAERISMEALASLQTLELSPIPTHYIVQADRGAAESALEGALRQIHRLSQAEAVRSAAYVRLKERFAIASHLVGGGILIAALAIASGVAWFYRGSASGVPIAIGAGIAAAAVLEAVTAKVGIAPAWLTTVRLAIVSLGKAP